MVDSYRMNNDLNHKFEHWHQVSQESKNEIHQQKATAQFGALVEYAKTMKISHQEVKTETAQLLRSLRKYGVLSEK